MVLSMRNTGLGRRFAVLFGLALCCQAGFAIVRPVKLLCHRTANEDVPENTLESLHFAALMGCNVVEVDVRRTLDGQLVLQHDGYLERLSDSAGEVEERYYGDLRLLDAGGWMGDRFSGYRIPLLRDALRQARREHVALYLDLKDKEVGKDVLHLAAEEGMLRHVQLGGASDDVRKLLPAATRDDDVWVQPGVSANEVQELHRKHKQVIANFSETEHAADLVSMKAAVAAGVDGINVDYPRLGAAAVGRPVEQRIAALLTAAGSGDPADRAKAMLALIDYRSPDLDGYLLAWLMDGDDRISRAAAVVLAQSQPRPMESEVVPALTSVHADVRANAAWLLGMLHAPASTFIPLLRDSDVRVQQEALMALAHADGTVATTELISLLNSSSYEIRGAAALAVARHVPVSIAAAVIAAHLNAEIATMTAMRDAWKGRGSPPLTEDEKARIVWYYRSQMQEVQALANLGGVDATRQLEALVLRPGRDFSVMDGAMAAYRLWDRMDDDPQPMVVALASAENLVADRSEWILLHARRSVLGDVRTALRSQNRAARGRAVVILALRGDVEALPVLVQMQSGDAEDSRVAAWAVATIQANSPQP